MSSETPAGARLPVVTPARVLAGLSLLLPVVAMLWVSSYTKETPNSADCRSSTGTSWPGCRPRPSSR